MTREDEALLSAIQRQYRIGDDFTAAMVGEDQACLQRLVAAGLLKIIRRPLQAVRIYRRLV